jgi:F0F1-type ATP synthase membrane subunit b/b'
VLAHKHFAIPEIYVSAIIQQLGLDQTFFIQFILFAALFLILANLYFKPFLKLFEKRHQRTIADREAAEALTSQAEQKFEEYKKRIAEERAAARAEFEAMLNEAKKEESNLLAQSRNEAKKITSEAAEAIHQQRDTLKRQLEGDVESLAKNISETLLRRRD